MMTLPLPGDQLNTHFQSQVSTLLRENAVMKANLIAAEDRMSDFSEGNELLISEQVRVLEETATELDRLNRGTREAVERFTMEIAVKDGEIRRLVSNTASSDLVLELRAKAALHSQEITLMETRHGKKNGKLLASLIAERQEPPRGGRTCPWREIS